MTKTPAQLDREIAEFLSKPQKLLDPQWESDWAELLAQKHAKARMPTIDELARALRYIEREYGTKGGRVDTEQWAEGLAFGRHAGDAEEKYQAKEMFKQLTPGKWLRVAERANYLAHEQGEAARYLK